jgi:hypothetical protein
MASVQKDEKFIVLHTKIIQQRVKRILIILPGALDPGVSSVTDMNARDRNNNVSGE